MIILYMPVNQNNLTMNKQLISHISQERQASVSVSKNEKHSIHSIYAELLLKYGLSKYFKIDGQLIFDKTKEGKPFLAEYKNIDFNISHTDGMVLCGITDSGRVGVDVEHNRKVHKNVSAKVFHLDEISYVNSSPEQSEDRFFEIWTKKEAYTKYLGTGLRNNITDINTLSGEHLNKLHFKKIEDFFFSVYSDDIFTEPIKINYSEISNYL